MSTAFPGQPPIKDAGAQHTLPTLIANMVREGIDRFALRVARGELIWGTSSVHVCPICGQQRASYFTAPDQVVMINGQRRVICAADASLEARRMAGMQPAERAEHLERLWSSVTDRDNRERVNPQHFEEYEALKRELGSKGGNDGG